MNAIAYCGLACCVCSENKDCIGCQDGGCESYGWCKNYNCCKEKGLNGCWECSEFPCTGCTLGLHHIFAGTHHYGPEPWYAPEGLRIDWLPKYYHKAGADGIGFDRTRSGSGNVDQYHEPLASMYNSLETCPEELLLWFHHIPWDHRMSSGRTFWDEMCHRYDRGIKKVREYQKVWEDAKPYVDTERWEAVNAKLAIQESDARWWRDACVQYFGEFSGMPVPADVEQPQRPLEELKKIKLNMLHHN